MVLSIIWTNFLLSAFYWSTYEDTASFYLLTISSDNASFFLGEILSLFSDLSESVPLECEESSDYFSVTLDTFGACNYASLPNLGTFLISVTTSLYALWIFLITGTNVFGSWPFRCHTIWCYQHKRTIIYAWW